MATDIIARGMAANAKKSVTELGNKVESEKWIGTKAEWEAVDKSTIKDGTIVYITDDKTVILYDKAEMEKIAAQVATDRKAAETAAQKAQSVADSLPEDYVTAVAKIAENTANIASIKLTDKEMKRRVDALYDIGQGITHQFETDSETAYQKTVPTGGKLMSVKNIGGRSIVWNQLYKKFGYVDGSTLNCKSIFKSHNYLLRVDYSVSENTKVYLYFRAAKYTAGTNRQIVKDITAGSGKISWITSPLGEHSDGGDFGVFRLVTDSDGNQKLDTSPFSNYEIFDLTQMFGIGNEPTSVEEFEAMFPNNYYQYNAGEIITADTESVVVQGKNLINADDYYAPYKQSDGSYVNDSVGFANINIPIGNFIGKTLVATLKATVSAQPTSFFWAARINGLKVESSYEKGERVLANTTGIAKLAVTPKTQNDTLAMSFGQGRGDVIVRDIQIELGDTPTAYAPFHRNEYPIPEAIKALPGYGWSAGTARNYVDYENKRYVQCVNSVDLGTLTWTAGGGISSQTVFIASSRKICGQKLSYNSAIASNILCSKYLAKSQNEVWSDAAPVGIATNATIDGYVYVNDTAYTDATAFKQAMQGVILYYELANPIVTDISDLIPDDFLRNIEVEAGGSITFKNSNGDDYRIPVPSEEEYVVKLSEVGGTT